MPITPTYPGVYIEEVSSGVRTISPVGTSLTAFVGGATWGIDNTPVRVSSFADFERKFGGLDARFPLGFSVSQFFLNGGSEAMIVRVTAPDSVAALVEANGLQLQVVSPGAWGNGIRVRVDHDTKEPKDGEQLFNLYAYHRDSNTIEEFRNVSPDPDHKRFVGDILSDASVLIELQQDDQGQQIPAVFPGDMGEVEGTGEWFELDGAFFQATGGAEGSPISDADLIGKEVDKTGFHALLKTNDYFSMLVIPPATFAADVAPDTYGAANAFLNKPTNHKRAILLVDAPSGWKSVSQASTGIKSFRATIGGTDTHNAALFFPRARMADPLKEGRLREFTVSGAVAGVAASTDLSRGIWKSPAGVEASLKGIHQFSVSMNDPENGLLNPQGINCLRNMGVYGNVIWGSRTMAGFDQLGSEWKYLAVRRFALYLEENLYRGTQWVVFEPNDEPLWAQIRLNIGTFMQDLFRQGAFQGGSPQEAYSVRCDSTTTTQSDINRGIVNIEVGFAPLKPAEFVILKIQQIQKDS